MPATLILAAVFAGAAIICGALSAWCRRKARHLAEYAAFRRQRITELHRLSSQLETDDTAIRSGDIAAVGRLADIAARLAEIAAEDGDDDAAELAAKARNLRVIADRAARR